jgi:hypothetical protein
MQEPGHEANSVAPRRQLASLALRASTDASLGARSSEFKTLSENKFAELIHMCDMQEKTNKQSWKLRKDEAIQERIDELRQLGQDRDAKKLERK